MVWCSLFKATKWQGLPQTFPISCSYKKDKLLSWALLQADSKVQAERESPQSRTDHYPLCSHSLSGTMEMLWQTSSTLLCSSFRGLTLRRDSSNGWGALCKRESENTKRPEHPGILRLYTSLGGVCQNGLWWSQVLLFSVNKMEGLIKETPKSTFLKPGSPQQWGRVRGRASR